MSTEPTPVTEDGLLVGMLWGIALALPLWAGIVYAAVRLFW